MSKVILRKTNLARRKVRIKKKVFGTNERPRLSVFKSNNYTTAQIINDVDKKTLASISLNEIKKMHKGKNKVDAAKEVGKKLAEVALKNNIKKVVFDRKGNKYHGRVKNLADGAREGGLEL